MTDSDTHSPSPPPPNAKPCPICGKPAAQKYRPFCSSRCADIDLHRWLGGVYRVETDEAPDTPTGREAD